MSSSVCLACGSAGAEPYPTPFPDPIVRCRRCGTRFVHPVPSDRSLRQRYEAEHRTGKWGKLFDESDAGDPPRRAGLLARLLGGGPSGRRLLDIGCGDGRFLAAAAQVGWRPVGIELSLEAARRAGPHPVAVSPVAALRAGPRFAAVTFWDVLEHLPAPAAAVRGAAALLEPGGLLAVSLPNAAGAEALLCGSRWRYHDLAVYGHLVHFGPAQLDRLLEGAGLEIVHRETRGSVDLREVLGREADRGVRRPLAWLLDRASGVLARVAEPALRGNTLLVVARRRVAPPDPPR